MKIVTPIDDEDGEMPLELDEDFFTKATLNKPGENLIDSVSKVKSIKQDD